MHSLSRLRPFCRTLSSRQSSQQNKPVDSQEIVQKLINRAEEYRKELRKHIQSSVKHRELAKSITGISKTLNDLEMKRKQLNDIFEAALKPDLVSLEILSNGTTHICPSIFVRTPTVTYLFNCPEGSSRFIPSVKVRPQTVQNFFITRGNWDCFGGLFGVLLAKEELNHVTHLHGPSNLKYFLDCVRPFADIDTGSLNKQTYQVEEHTLTNEKYEDNAMNVYYIPVFEMNSNPRVALSQKSCDVAYLLELKEPNKRIDLMKVMAKNVPNGPLIGKLKAGHSVLLEDGTTVEPWEVYAEDSKDYCPNILVVDCDDISKLESLITNGHLQKYTNKEQQMGYIAHFTPDAVLKDAKYKEWMQSFGERCLHLIVNGTGEAVPLTDGLYRQQHMLNEICPDLFPAIFLIDFRENVTQTVNMPTTNVVHAKNMEKYPMRSTNLSSINDAISLSLETSEMNDRILDEKTLVSTIEEFREKVKKLDLSDDQYPSVAFLGTGSAVPTKYRNVSGQLLQLNADTCVLIDCGEGTYGQMKSIFGPEKIDDMLVNLKAAFITHAHLDHIGGLKTIAKRRFEAFEKKGLEYKQLLLACNYNVKKVFTMYRTSFENLDQLLSFVEIGVYVKNFEEYTKYTVHDLSTEITQKFPKTLYSAEDWNLKKVIAVQVHHTRMANGFIFETCDGKRIVFSGDTMPCKLLAELGKDADLLIHEATFGDDYETDAKFKKHSTTGQAVDISKKMNAKFTILTHFSARYNRVPFLDDPIMNAGNVGIAFDNMVVPFNKRPLLPLLLPVYVKLFSKELHLLRKY